MRIVGRMHSRTYRPELCISIRAFGAQVFIVTMSQPSCLTGTVWDCPELSRSLLDSLGLFRTLWGCLILSGAIWDYMALSRTHFWDSLGLSGVL